MKIDMYSNTVYYISSRGARPYERSQFERIQFERINEMYFLSEYNLSEFQNYFQFKFDIFFSYSKSIHFRLG